MLRIYEASGKPANGVEIKFHVPVSSASETNLLGDEIRPLAAANGTLRVDLRPFEIKTLKLKLHTAESNK
jgi:alpha-mannosidase